MSKIPLINTFFLAAILFVSCQSKSKTTITDIPETPQKDKLSENQTDFNAMVEKINVFSLGFFKTISKSNYTENVSFSPASLNMAMAVVYSGSAGQTQKQISDVFGYDPQLDEFHPQYHEYFTEIVNIRNDTLVEFDLANRVYLEKSYPVLDQYITDVEKWHAGAFEKLDFIHQPRQAEETINEWVEELTRKRITGLIPPGSLNELTRLVLVNAIYIKSSWKYPFDKDRSADKDFMSSSGQKVKKKFMIQQKSNIPYYEQDDFTAIELPYTTQELSLIIIRPNDSLVQNISDYVPDEDIYKKMLHNMRFENVKMEIPRFKIESEFSLSNNLKKAGMQQAFDNRADFSGINGLKDLSISDVFQKVFFEMDEEGSEAAAATGIVMVTTSMPVDPPQPKEFIADRPFVFILKENRFNTPLFIGHFVK
jgi:serpin B